VAAGDEYDGAVETEPLVKKFAEAVWTWLWPKLSTTPELDAPEANPV
jgi:hypothetical protein